MVAGKGAPEEPEPPVVPDVPAGGLDVPLHEGPLAPSEENRWLILHFALPRTLMTSDFAAGRSTDVELNEVLSEMAWGSVQESGGDWALEGEELSLEPPHPSLISYAEYVARSYPVDLRMEEGERDENKRMASQKRATFTNSGEPGARFRAMFDQMVKNLAHSNKALIRAFDLKKDPTLTEDEVPDPNASAERSLPEEQKAIMRFGRHQVLPAFWHMLMNLNKNGRRFSLVLRTFDEDQLKAMQKELQLFCQGQHPAYCGQNKTLKPPPMSGDKNSRDMRLTDANIGRLDRMGEGLLEFRDRPVAAPSAAAPTPAVPAEEQGDEPVEEEAPVVVQAAPTVYNLQNSYHEAYAGLEKEILNMANTAAIVDDLQHWESNDRAASAGKLLLIDHDGGCADPTVQHIFFDGSIQRSDAYCVDVRDVVKGEPIQFGEAESCGCLHRVDLFQAVTDVEYFCKALQDCEDKMSSKIMETRRHEAAVQDAEGAPAHTQPPKEYLYCNVIPALLPALEACQRDRPADPIEFIAFYMLRHTKQYSKTLKA